MKLYYSSAACSLASHIALREAGLVFELEKVDLATKITGSGADFRAINIKGYVPALALDNGDLLTEGPAIMLWAAAQAPAGRLAPPPGGVDYLRLLEQLFFIATELHKSFSPLFNPAVTDDVKPVFRDRLFSRFDCADGKIGDGPYAMGATFSIADIYLFTVLGWLRFINVDLGRWPHLAALSARVAERPAVQAALAAEGLA